MTAQLKTVRELIRISSQYLTEKGIESARLGAELLLADVLGVSRLELYVQHDRPVAGEELDRYRDYIRRRGTGEPLQTLIGTVEFYSRPFKVQAGVFIPRPETERLVAATVELLTPPDRRYVAPLAVEIGCGSGVVAVSLAAEVPQLEIYATDTNPQAVALSEHNARLRGVAGRTHFLTGSRFDPLPDKLRGQVDLLVSNPPYIRRGEIASLAVEVAHHDPHEALDGGEDGLDVYRALASAMDRWLRPGAWVALEIGHHQADAVASILAASGAERITTHQDYNGHDRVVTAQIDRAESGD